ncbi:MAG: serine--tRNA ligase [Alphaproteobacteria bacterium]
MLDIKLIRENPAMLDAQLARRNQPAQAAALVRLDEQRRALQTRQQEVQAKRNTLSKKVGELKAAKQDADALMAEVKALGPEMEHLAFEEKQLADKLDDMLARIANFPAEDVPAGADEHDNQEVARWGTPRTFDFKVREHDDLVAALGLLDLPTAAKIAGARFSWLKGNLARLERAIAQFFLDELTAKGFLECRVPYLVNEAAAYGTGNLPKFKEDLFQTTDGRWLIPTSEVPLTNVVADKIVQPEDLPLRMTAWTPCFRSEAGSSGKDTKGLIRQHQFDKVEMVIISKPEESEAEHQRMLACAQSHLEKLKLPYRTIVLCTGDMGFASRKTYDIEVWIPSQNTYREISSCSNCGDFQARRMKARMKTADGNVFVHTLNGSGLAVGRTLVAILENYQNADGTVTIPDVLQPYMGGVTKLEALT